MLSKGNGHVVGKPIFDASYSRKPNLYIKTQPRKSLRTGISQNALCLLGEVKVRVTLRPTISRSVRLGFEPHLGLMIGY
jgi:hypothetical protein